jgi:hypothetical protein
VVVIGVFKHGTCVCHINDNRSSAFSDSSRYHHFQNAIEGMQGASGGSQITSYLLLTTLRIASSEKHVGINYIFFSNRLCKSTSGEKGKV